MSKRHIILLLFLICFMLGYGQQHKEPEGTHYGQDSLRFFSFNDTLVITIIDYVPASDNCGGGEFSAWCLGVNATKDTILVLSLCERDSAYHKGMKIWVTPEKVDDVLQDIPPSRAKTKIKWPITYGDMRKY
jgi:hypothetical protein